MSQTDNFNFQGASKENRCQRNIKFKIRFKKGVRVEFNIIPQIYTN